jgi:hypothetical protein
MKKIDYEIADFRHSGVNDTAVTKNDLLLTPIFFVCGIVQHNLPMFFFIDIPIFLLKVARVSRI